MHFTHFFGRINDSNWTTGAGTNILLGFGPTSCQALREALRVLRERPEWQSIELQVPELADFSVRQVPSSDGMMSAAVKKLGTQLLKAVGPLPIPGGLLPNMLLLTDEFDELTASRVVVGADGLEVSVKLPDVLGGRSFAVAGSLLLLDLPIPFQQAISA